MFTEEEIHLSVFMHFICINAFTAKFNSITLFIDVFTPEETSPVDPLKSVQFP